MPLVEWLALAGHALPQSFSGALVDRVHHPALTRLIVRGIAVAVQARTKCGVRSAADRAGHENAIAPDDEETVAAGADAKSAKNWLLGVVRAKMNETGCDAAGLRRHVRPDRLAGLIALIATGTISGSMAKDVFETMFTSGRPAGDIMTSEGLAQIDDDSALLTIVRDVLAKQPDAVSQ